MKVLLIMLLTASVLSGCQQTNIKANISGYTVKDIDLNEAKLSSFKEKVLLIVNVASKCGFTPQYKGLQTIYDKYKDQGFEILGFPCNDFGEQEPGTNEEIKNFCSVNFNVTFPMFDKIALKGAERSPLFELLTNNETTGQSPVEWNFEKFVIDKEGNIVERFKSSVKPEDEKITSLIEAELKK